MFFNDLYRKLRFRSDDPLRYLHVPRRHRLDMDDPAEIDTTDDRAIDLRAIADDPIIAEEELL
ncbi:MAG: hypothetical protein AAFZ07_25135 [Actinomycetota bacterium]